MRRDVLAHGDFAQAFWQCEQCNQWLAEQPDLRVCDGLRATASALRQETTQRLQAAMVQSCTSFQGPRFAQVCAAATMTDSVWGRKGCSAGRLPR